MGSWQSTDSGVVGVEQILNRRDTVEDIEDVDRLQEELRKLSEEVKDFQDLQEWSVQVDKDTHIPLIFLPIFKDRMHLMSHLMKWSDAHKSREGHFLSPNTAHEVLLHGVPWKFISALDFFITLFVRTYISDQNQIRHGYAKFPVYLEEFLTNCQLDASLLSSGNLRQLSVALVAEVNWSVWKSRGCHEVTFPQHLQDVTKLNTDTLFDDMATTRVLRLLVQHGLQFDDKKRFIVDLLRPILYCCVLFQTAEFSQLFINLVILCLPWSLRPSILDIDNLMMSFYPYEFYTLHPVQGYKQKLPSQVETLFTNSEPIGLALQCCRRIRVSIGSESFQDKLTSLRLPKSLENLVKYL